MLSPRTKSEIFIGDVPDYIYLKVSQEAPGEAQPSCLVKSKKPKVLPSFSTKESQVFDSNHNSRDRVLTKSVTNSKDYSVQTYPTVAAKSVTGIKNPRTQTMSRKAFQ